MNPTNSNAGMELPPPIEQPAVIPSVEAGTNAEQEPAKLEASPSPIAGSMAIPPPPTIPLPTPSTPAVTTQADDSQSVSTSQLLSDKDLIDKEWVNKAKAIVNKTREDPYKQTEDLTLLKADYMKKQFNKTLKINK